MKHDEHRRDKLVFSQNVLVAFIILIVFIGIFSAIYVIYVNSLTEESCYSILSDYSKESCSKIENHFKDDRASLRMLARVIANEKDLYSNEVNNYLVSYDVNSLVTNIAILTPEKKIIQPRHNNMPAGYIMDFDTEASLGEHISGHRESTIDSDTEVMYNFIPIRSGGKTVGMLFTELNPAAIARAWSPEMYDGRAFFCIIDRSTGDILINDWVESITNISQIGNEALTERIGRGEEGFLEIESEELFASYMPMELENWEIVFFVNKDVAFASADRMHRVMRIFLVGMAGGFIMFMLYVGRLNRKAISEAERNANIDVLTGLQNRNRYEGFCSKLKGKEKGVTCIYIDANGLHEINNSKGHLAGDQMLRFIADSLKVLFGEDMTYRIGGDEFVVFQRDRLSEDIEKDLAELDEKLGMNDYHASSGLCSAEEGMETDEMIKTAEKRMYENKRRYYEQTGRAVRNQL